MSSEAARKFTRAIQDVVRLDPIITPRVLEIYDRHQPNVSASESLYAFFGHLCNLPDPIVLSKKHNPVRIHDLIEKFCKLNNIPDPEPGWEKRLNPKFYREVMKMNGDCVMHHQPLSLCPECNDNQIRRVVAEKEVIIAPFRETLIGISVEDCNCTYVEGKGSEVVREVMHQCPRCRALEVLEETKGK